VGGRDALTLRAESEEFEIVADYLERGVTAKGLLEREGIGDNVVDAAAEDAPNVVVRVRDGVEAHLAAGGGNLREEPLVDEGVEVAVDGT
jgi:hypothetical protein